MDLNNVMSWISNPIGSLFGNGSSGTIWNHGSGYQVPSVGESANSFSGSGMDPNGFVAGVWNDITGVTAQSREFAQQEYLMDKQNEYNTPLNEMRRMREAGINPNVAAGGIASNGSPSASPSQVPTNAGGTAAAMQAAASGLSGLSQAGLNKSQIDVNQAHEDLFKAQARDIDRRFGLDTDIAIGELAAKLVGIGVPELEAAIMAFDIGKGGYETTLQYLKGFAGLRKYDEQLNILTKEKEMKQKEIDRYDEIIDAEVNESKKKALVDEKTAKQIEVDTWFKEEKKNIISEIPALLFDGNQQLLYIAETYGTDSDIYKNLMQTIRDTSYSQIFGEMSAQIDTAYTKTWNEFKAKNDVDAMFAPFKARLEYETQSAVQLIKSVLENPKDIDGALMKYINQLYNIWKDDEVNDYTIGSFIKHRVAPGKGFKKSTHPKPWE